MIVKSIKDLAWNVSEEEYRADSAVSYSTLSQFDREGVSCIPHLKDKKDSQALRFGSLTDTLMTEPETLEQKFVIADFFRPSDTITKIVTNIWDNCDKTITRLEKVNPELILLYINEENYQTNWKDATRINKIIEEGQEYFSLLKLSENKILMSQYDYNSAVECVDTLKMSNFTGKYFYVSPLTPHIEGHFQLKFRLVLGKYAIRCMFDRIIVDHKAKTIQPVDLKTTGKPEEGFEESFEGWRYYLQSSMYSYILRKLCEKDEYFKDFTVLPFIFVCINRYSLKPLAWVDENSVYDRSVRLNKEGKIMKPWYVLLEELLWHMENNKLDYSYESYKSGGLRKLTNLTLVNNG